MHAVLLIILFVLSTCYASCSDPGYGVLPHLNALHQVHMGGLFLELQDWQAAFHTQPGIQKLSKYYDNLAGFRSQAPPHFPPSVTDPVGSNHEIRLHKVQNVDPACSEKKNHYYRSLDGKCNWIANASYGVAGKGFDRARPSQYADGFNAPRKAPTPQATPRNLSNTFFDPSKKGPIKNWQHSSWLSALVEFVIGDLFGPTPSTEPEDTYQIPIPKGDRDFDPEGTGNKSFWFTRHAKVPGTGVPGKPREILNTRTPWFDLDPIYGINEHDNRLLRTLVDGKMKLSADGHLPLLTELGGDLSFKMFGKDPANLFASGDPRANRDAFLVTFINVFVKEHNRLCDVLMQRYPQGLSDGPWTDELLFLTARSMLSIKYQTIAMNYFESYFIETPSFQYGGMGFNPFIFIQETNEMSQVKVNPYLTYPPDIHWGQHGTPDPLAPPNVPLIETDIAYRYHDIVPSVVPLVCEGGFRCGEHSITHASYKADIIKQYGLNNIIRGMATNALPDFGTGLSAELRSVKFDLGNPAIKNKFDLAAWSIERERSNGVPTWNEFFGKNSEGKNLWNGKPPYDIGPKINWEDFSDDPEMVEQLQFFYDHPDQVDMAVAMELEAERWPATALPKSIFAANILGLINQGLIDRFSLSIAQSRCLVEDKPWDCHPSNIVEELLWPYIPEFGLRWYDQFWLDEFDINNDGAQTLWGIIVKNTDVKCLPLNPLFLESPTNPIMCYNVTAFPSPDPREFLVLTTPKGQTAALWNNLSTYGDAVYYRFPPIEAGNVPLPVSHNILISTKELFKQTIIDSTAWNLRPVLPLFEYLYSATMNKHVYGEEPKRQYAIVNNFGPNWGKLVSVLDNFYNPMIVGWIPIFNVVHMNYLKYGWLNDLAHGGPAGIDLPVAIRTYQTMVTGQMALGFQFYVNTSKSLTEIIDKSHMTTWVTLFMTCMDYNLPGMAWPPSVNYTNDQRMESFAHLVRTVWKEDPLNLDYIADFLSSLGIAISDRDFAEFHKYIKLTKPAVLHFKDQGFDVETIIPVMVDVVGANMIPSQYMEHALWRLSCDQDYQERIYQAVKGHTIDYHFLATNPGAHLIMKYVKEMTRYMPLGAGIGARVSNQRTTLDGKLIEKAGAGSTTLMWNGGRIGRDPKNFKNPNVFDADRWTMESGEDGLWDFVYNTYNYSVIEFGAGERKCPGTFNAFVGIAHFIGEMIKTYKFDKISEEKCQVDPVPMLSPFGQWFVPGDLDVRFKIRQEDKFEVKFDASSRFKETVQYLENLGQKVWDGLAGHPKKSPLKQKK